MTKVVNTFMLVGIMPIDIAFACNIRPFSLSLHDRIHTNACTYSLSRADLPCLLRLVSPFRAADARQCQQPQKCRRNHPARLKWSSSTAACRARTPHPPIAADRHLCWCARICAQSCAHKSTSAHRHTHTRTRTLARARDKTTKRRCLRARLPNQKYVFAIITNRVRRQPDKF